MTDKEGKTRILEVLFKGVLAAALAMAAFSLYAWFQLPEDAMIATHWNVAGEADDYSSKTFGLAIFPAIALFLAGLLKALPYMEPRRRHFERSPKLVAACFIGVVLVMFVAQITVIGTALGWAVNVFFLIKIAIGSMMMLIGNYAAKSKSMFLVGFRTPWTLSSEVSWQKTHRLFGKLFMLCGLILVLLPVGWFSKETFAAIFIALILVPVLISMVYSWFVWRGEQKDG